LPIPPFGRGLPNGLIATLAYNSTVDVWPRARSAAGRCGTLPAAELRLAFKDKTRKYGGKIIY
jgi:hypothetical protein